MGQELIQAEGRLRRLGRGGAALLVAVMGLMIGVSWPSGTGLQAQLPGAGAAAKPIPLDAETAGKLRDARQRWMKGNLEEAQAQFEALSQSPAGESPATISLARIDFQKGNWAAGLKRLDPLVNRQPPLAEALAWVAHAKYQQGAWEDAEAAAQKAVAIEPNQLLAKWTLAQLASDRGQLSEADQLTRSIVRYYTARSNADQDIRDPDELLVVAMAGAENARRNNLSKQFSFILNEVLADALKAEPAFWPAEVLAGDMLLEKYNRPSAVEAYDKALTIDPRCAPALVGLAQAALTRFDTKEVDRLATEALKIQPQLIEAMHLRGMVDLIAGDLAAAEKKYRQALAWNPRRADTLGRLAGVVWLQRRTREFEALCQQAEQFDRKPAAFYTQLADTLEQRKRFVPAEEYFRKAIALRPNVSTAQNALGLLQLRLGDESAGRQSLTEALKADPFNIRTANSLKVLKHLESYSTKETAHYILKYDREKDRILAEYLADYLETIHAELKQQFQYEPPSKTLVEVFSNHDMFSGRTTGLPDLHTIGACTGRVLLMASPRAKGVARPFHWGRVIRHELTHIFNLAQTEFTCPHWLTEGLAVGNERMARPQTWTAILRERYLAKELFNLDTILFGFVRPKNGSEWMLAYCQSRLYVEYLIQAHGPESIAKLLNAYRGGQETAEALRAATGVDQATFEKGYVQFVESVLKPYLGEGGAAPTPARPVRPFDELQKAHQADPADADTAADLAEAYLRRDEPKKAKALVDTILQQQPTHAAATLVRARLLLRAGESEAAKASLEKLRANQPRNPRVLLMLARLYLESKEYEDAAEILEAGRRLAPLDGDWLPQLAQLYRETEQPEKLQGVLMELVDQDPDELKARLELAEMAAGRKDHPVTERFAREVLFIDVLHPTARELLITALELQGRADEATKIRNRYLTD